MYPNGQNGFNGAPPEGNFGGNRPPFYGGGFYGQPLWMDPREVERRNERRKIRRHMNWIGGGALLTLAFETVFMTLAVTFFMALGLSYSDFYEYAAMYVVFSPVCIALPFVISAKACKFRVSDIVTFKKHSPLLGIGVFLLAFWGIAAGNIAADVLVSVVPALEASSSAADLPVSNGIIQIVTELLYAAAIPALIEEFAFRGIITGGCRKWGDKFAIVIGSVFFALIHGNLVQMPATFIAGLFMGYAYVRTGCLWTSIAIHFANNAMSIALSTLSEKFAFMNTPRFVLVLYASWVLMGLVGFILVKIHDRRLEGKPALKKYEGCLDAGGVAGVAASSPAVIVAFAVFVLYAVGLNVML